MAFLEVKNLMKKYDQSVVLKGVSATLEKGEVLAVIGTSGGGKTTFLRCLNLLAFPDGGSISVDGEELLDFDHEKISEAEIRSKRLKFGLVFQSFNLFPQYTAVENVELAKNLLDKTKLKEKKEYSKGAWSSVKQKNREEAMELLRKVGLEERANFYPYQLSGGQCQRVAIARALALSPEILCFDEPTSALDPELTGEVLKVIKELRDEGRTMIIVTHEMEFAKNVADKVLFIADGEVAEEGEPKEIFENPKTEKLKAFLKKND